MIGGVLKQSHGIFGKSCRQLVLAWRRYFVRLWVGWVTQLGRESEIENNNFPSGQSWT